MQCVIPWGDFGAIQKWFEATRRFRPRKQLVRHWEADLYTSDQLATDVGERGLHLLSEAWYEVKMFYKL